MPAGKKLPPAVIVGGVGAAALGLYLLYRHFTTSSASTAGASTSAGSPNPLMPVNQSTPAPAPMPPVQIGPGKGPPGPTGPPFKPPPKAGRAAARRTGRPAPATGRATSNLVSTIATMAAATPAAAAGPGIPAGAAGGGTYVNPFRAGGVTGQRIDQGVDYAAPPGTPIGALGRGRIVAAESSGSGWPGGGFIAEQLSGGPARGQVVYTAENVAPAVRIGQQVKAGQMIGRFTSGGIESGWGTRPPNVGQALAYGTQSAPGIDPGAYSTGYGIAFNKLIRRLGGPAGVLQSRISGTAPALFSNPGARKRAPSAVPRITPPPPGRHGTLNIRAPIAAAPHTKPRPSLPLLPPPRRHAAAAKPRPGRSAGGRFRIL